MDRLRAVFALADADHDGRISYWEFLFFLKLLAST
jgi:Ca2+-binding EF-hand superfamily protein